MPSHDTARFWTLVAVFGGLFGGVACSGDSGAASAGAGGASAGATGGAGNASSGAGGLGGGGVNTNTGGADANTGGASAGDGGASAGAAGGSGNTSSAGGALGTGGTDFSGDAGGGGGDGPCVITADAALCKSRPIVTIVNGSDTRRIYWNTPKGEAPAGGFPAVVLYQGSIYGPSLSWDVSLPLSTAFGGYYQVVLISKLLDAGFTVLQPEAQGGVAWNTNSGGNYDTSPDSVFIPQMLDQMSAGNFGAIDMTRLYATGISSGGYMTSRMAVSYPGKFRALAIESGSYATCVGPLCVIPTPLPADHPPTLFLHGDVDNIVPIATAQAYYNDLVAQGIETKFIEDPTAGHQWIPAAPDAVTTWFLGH